MPLNSGASISACGVSSSLKKQNNNGAKLLEIYIMFFTKAEKVDILKKDILEYLMHMRW